MIASFLMTAAASAAIGGWRTLEAWQLGYLGASSLFGIVIATTTYFAAIYTAGARTTALLFSLASPFALLLGYLVLGETIDIKQVSACFWCSLALWLSACPPQGQIHPQRRSRGPASGSASSPPSARRSAAFVPARPWPRVSSRSPPWPCAPALQPSYFLVATLLPVAALREKTTVGWDVRLLALGSAFFGTGLGMSLLMAALAHGNVGIVSTLSSMTPVMILPMVWARSGTAPPKPARSAPPRPSAARR